MTQIVSLVKHIESGSGWPDPKLATTKARLAVKLAERADRSKRNALKTAMKGVAFGRARPVTLRRFSWDDGDAVHNASDKGRGE